MANSQSKRKHHSGKYVQLFLADNFSHPIKSTFTEEREREREREREKKQKKEDKREMPGKSNFLILYVNIPFKILCTFLTDSESLLANT